MAPAQHIEWFTDNVNWFRDLPVESLDVSVPACPGWTVENVITHLAYGLGLGYPHAMAADPACPDAEVFADFMPPVERPAGHLAIAEFERTMFACRDLFAAVDPAMSCYTYEGPGVAAFWFRRAAIETTLHRMDVVEALDIVDVAMAAERVVDAIAESVEFALPLAERWTATPGSSATHSSVRVHLRSSATSFTLGSGPVHAEITGDGVSLLGALWGRSRHGIEIQGDAQAASDWMSLVERAFAGR